MNRPDFKSAKVEAKKEEVNIKKAENVVEVLESMLDKNKSKIKNLKSFKQDILVELSKLFELPHDQKCAVMRDNLQQLSIERVINELEKNRNRDDNYNDFFSNII